MQKTDCNEPQFPKLLEVIVLPENCKVQSNLHIPNLWSNTAPLCLYAVFQPDRQSDR